MQRLHRYDIRPCEIGVVQALCARYHAYKGAGTTAVACQAVFEDGQLVAAFSWQPPPPGAAEDVSGDASGGVLALSRMIAVPRAERRKVRHISKPLRFIMRDHLDRTRWPILITYSDESLVDPNGEPHTGHVYKCSGWRKTVRNRSPAYEDGQGRRVSSYRNGAHDAAALTRIGDKWTQWEHWINERPLEYMTAAGWRRVPVPGKFWRSGSQAFTWINVNTPQMMLF